MSMGELGARPISADKPQGRNVRDDDIFFELKSEMDKLSSPSGRAGFSWETVAALSTTILKSHSKDLLAASYLGVALVNLKKDQGLDEATDMYWNLVKNHWDTLYPSKPRGRMAALNWWIEKTGQVLAGPQWTIQPKHVKAVSSRLNDLAGFLGSRMESPPSFSELIRTVSALGSQQEAGGDKPGDKDKARPASMPPAETDLSQESVQITGDSPDEAIRVLSPLFQKIKTAAKLFRDERVSNPQAYTWLRFSVWEPIRALPPSSDGLTRIGPPAAQTVTHLKRMFKEEDLLGLIQASESALASARNLFVMDLNFYTWTALDKLGKKYHAARDAVYFETRTFMKRMNGLDQLLFSDRTPFVSDQARDWLERQDEIMKGTGTVAGPETGSAHLLDREIAEVMERQAQGGLLTEAVQTLQDRIQGCASKKDAMVLKLGLARLLIAEKQERIALAHLDSILEDMDRHRLDSWDPAFALDTLKLVYKVFKKQGDPRYKNRSFDVLARIANISTSDAMSL